MAAFKKYSKGIKNEHILLFLGLVFLLFVLHQYSQNKNVFQYGMTPMNRGAMKKTPPVNGSIENTGSVVGSSSANTYAPYNGTTEMKQPGSMHDMNKPIANPADLLPASNNSWANMNPVSDLKNINLLNPTQLVGINTQGSSLRNANLQIRSEPANPRLENVGPWNIPTIEGDKFRKHLEIGSPAS